MTACEPVQTEKKTMRLHSRQVSKWKDNANNWRPAEATTCPSPRQSHTPGRRTERRSVLSEGISWKICDSTDISVSESQANSRVEDGIGGGGGGVAGEAVG